MSDSDLPHVLISNDDGYDAPGLAALYRALSGLARVSVVAPARGVSSAGHGVSDKRRIHVRQEEVEPFGRIHIVDALPADCARLGLTELVESEPDWVISGINRGGNLGVDVFYSGTVAVAREGAFLGVPGVAISQYIRRRGADPDWDRAGRWVRSLLQRIFAAPPEARPAIWNINLPWLEHDGEPRGIQAAPMALTPLHVAYKWTTSDQEGARDYQFAGQYSDREAPEGTDVYYAFNDYIAITPLALDLTWHPVEEIAEGIADGAG